MIIDIGEHKKLKRSELFAEYRNSFVARTMSGQHDTSVAEVDTYCKSEKSPPQWDEPQMKEKKENAEVTANSEMSQEKERRVILLGKVGAGKRTIASRLAGDDLFQSKIAESTANMTRQPGAYPDTFKRDGITCHVLTVDTESLQVGYNNPLQQIIHNFETINAIIFVIPHGRYTDESHDSLMHAIKHLQDQAKHISMLVITHCEGILEDVRKDIVDEFTSDARSSQVAASMGKGIHTVGFPDLRNIPQLVEDVYKEAGKKDSNALFNVIKNSNNSVFVNKLLKKEERPYERHPVANRLHAQASYGHPSSGHARRGWYRYLCKIL